MSKETYYRGKRDISTSIEEEEEEEEDLFVFDIQRYYRGTQGGVLTHDHDDDTIE